MSLKDIAEQKNLSMKSILRNQLWEECRKYYEGPFDFRTINDEWKKKFIDLGYNPKTNSWEGE